MKTLVKTITLSITMLLSPIYCMRPNAWAKQKKWGETKKPTEKKSEKPSSLSKKSEKPTHPIQEKKIELDPKSVPFSGPNNPSTFHLPVQQLNSNLLFNLFQATYQNGEHLEYIAGAVGELTALSQLKEILKAMQDISQSLHLMNESIRNNSKKESSTMNGILTKVCELVEETKKQKNIEISHRTKKRELALIKENQRLQKENKEKDKEIIQLLELVKKIHDALARKYNTK